MGLRSRTLLQADTSPLSLPAGSTPRPSPSSALSLLSRFLPRRPFPLSWKSHPLPGSSRKPSVTGPAGGERVTQQLGLHGLNHQSDAAWCASWLVLRATRASSRRRQCTARAPPSGLGERLSRRFPSCCQGGTKATRFTGERSGTCVTTEITQPPQPVLIEARNVLGAGNRQRPCSRWGAEGQKQADGGGRGAGDPPGVRADGRSGAPARTEVSVTRAQQRVDGWGACARTARAQWAPHLRASRVEGKGSGLESEAGEGRAGRCGRSS